MSEKMNHKYPASLHTPHLPIHPFPVKNTLYHCGPFLTMDELALIHYDEMKSVVHISSTLGITHSAGFNKCMTGSSHDGMKQNCFTALKVPCLPPVDPSLPPHQRKTWEPLPIILSKPSPGSSELFLGYEDWNQHYYSH